MISNCSRKPCGKNQLASNKEPAAFVCRPASRRRQTEELRHSWERLLFAEDPRREHGESTVEERIQSDLKAVHPPCPAWGHTAAPSSLRGADSPTSEKQPWAAKWKPGQQGSSWSWQTENNAPGKNKAGGSLEELHSEEPLPP